MPRVCLESQQSVLLVVDVQDALLPFIHESERVLARSSFLIRIANLLGISVIATEQNPTRMGSTAPVLAELVDERHPKMCFSACGCEAAMAEIRGHARRQAVVIGIETHICVSQTAHDLLDAGYEVVVCPDAVSARSLERHKLGMERIRDAGAVPAHTESVAYEWLRSAEHPLFRDALKIVKEYA
jgi:nicotinamidase-related amidase